MQKKKKRWPKILGITLLVIVVVLAAAALGGYLYLRNRFGTGTAEVHLTADGNTVVSVTGGDLTGGTEDGVYSFLGVPYATAPERFTAPEEAHWDGTFEAVSYGSVSPQQSMFGGSDFSGVAYRGNRHFWICQCSVVASLL